MKRYCFDTSGISTPLEWMPEDIVDGVWPVVCDIVEAGAIAVTHEIYEEMVSIGGSIGDCIRSNRDKLVLEIEDDAWPWKRYVSVVEAMQLMHRHYIAEYTTGSKGTVGVNDISIIALAKTLNLPLVSSEAPIRMSNNSKKRKIPNVCQDEGVQHLSFNDFMRAEKTRG